ncbi:MAG: hypothetical protein Fues2KO_41470 [Fuerstiella sp.]
MGLMIVGGLFEIGFMYAADSTQESRSERPVAGAETAADEKVREVIREVFPDLPEPVLAGWVDTYRDLSLQELRQLLQQRKELGGLIPTDRIQLPEFNPKRSQAASSDSLSSLERLAVQNLQNQLTDGYRCRKLKTVLASPDPTEVSEPQATEAEWDLTPGRSYSTGRLYDLTLPAEGRLMFRLEPGPVFTRFGRFERLADGSLGIQLDSGRSLRLHGSFRIPEETVEVTIADGELTIERRDDAASPKQTFHVAEVVRPSRLKSKNGVYFHIDGDVDQSVRMVPATITSRALEQSNVDVAEQELLLKNLESIRYFSRNVK